MTTPPLARLLVDGRPDQVVIESWLKSGMPKCLPETEPWTFTRSAHDFIEKFVGKKDGVQQ